LDGGASDECVQACELRLERAADLFAEREHALVGDSVVDMGAVLATGEHPCVYQHGEVLGDVLLAGAELLREHGHAELLVTEQVEDAHPERVAEGAEAAGDQFGEIFRERVGKSHTAIIS
jgi:hypothetical protein